MEYDDRTEERYSEVQSRLRRQMTFLTVVLGLVVLASAVAISFRGLNLSTPGDWALLLSLTFLLATSILSFMLVGRSVYHTVSSGELGYPTWGGIFRNRIPLTSLSGFYRKGRIPTSLNIVILSKNRRVLVIPEHNLATPSKFILALTRNGVPELSGRPR